MLVNCHTLTYSGVRHSMYAMRPERSVVKKAIVDAGGNKAKAAALLGCTRQSLYTWIYQYGLDKLAGVRMDSKERVDTAGRPSTPPEKVSPVNHLSNQPSGGAGSLRLVDQGSSMASDFPVQATLKVRASLWRQMKIEAIKRGVTVATLAEMAFQGVLADQQRTKKGSTK